MTERLLRAQESRGDHAVQQPPLLTGLLRPQAYPHDVEGIQLRETHISWVLLTGPFAYKIKKPGDLGFVDYTTLERRRHFCDEELRLNQRTAEGLYLDVVPITFGTEGYRVAGNGGPVEYAVRMHHSTSGIWHRNCWPISNFPHWTSTDSLSDWRPFMIPPRAQRARCGERRIRSWRRLRKTSLSCSP